MFESFENLPKEKKNRIINACIKEFAKNGYKKGSTNEIIKKANISKGILFHYFKNKKNLYFYIVDYVINHFYSIIVKHIKDMKSGDIFDIIRDITLIKLKIFAQAPEMYEFMAKAFLNPEEEVEEGIRKRYIEIYNDSFKILVEKFDTSMLREDIDKKRAIELLFISIDGISNKYIKEYKGREKEMIKEADKIVKEFEEYLHILKVGLYK